ncbi:MAG: transglycosylase SLT domain-containing protein [Gammaproteobacteria bacterium]
MHPIFRSFTQITLLASTLAAASAFASTSPYSDAVRKEFKQAYAQAAAGNSRAIRNASSDLKAYPLWTDVQAAHYRSQLGKISDKTVHNFIDEHAGSAAVNTLRYRFAKSLVKRGQWQRLNTLLTQHYANTTDDVMRCYAARTRLKIAPGKESNNQALDIWMSGSSLPEECDPVFAHLKDEKLLTTKRIRQRIDLAIDERNFKLARYLAKSGQRSDVERTNQWSRMRSDPIGELKSKRKLRDNQATRELLLYGIKRAARRDPESTYKMWPILKERFRFNREQRRDVERSIALSAARDHLPVALEWFKDIDEHNDDSGGWYVRRALASGDWPTVMRALDALPDSIREDTTWRYWRARALEAFGQKSDAETLYATISNERSYYGFLAADRLGVPYDFGHTPLQVDAQIMTPLENEPRIIRARELFLVGFYGAARSEWNRVIDELDSQQREQAALLAHSWNWHSRAINTQARTSGRDVMISYPTPYKAQFHEATLANGIDRTWAYGIARSESLFMPDVRSKANAYGLMQLIPSTGKLAAKQAHIKYRGTSTLLDPETNIKLGTHYLGQVYSQFGSNQVLATAAYNAGPHRVKTWLPDSTWHADIWVENVPFTETRRYVKKVLSAQAVTHWRLTGKEQRLAGMMPPILSNPGEANRFAER